MKRIVSGLLAAVTILSGALSPLAASATETGQEEKKPSVYEEVKDQLDEDCSIFCLLKKNICKTNN